MYMNKRKARDISMLALKQRVHCRIQATVAALDPDNYVMDDKWSDAHREATVAEYIMNVLLNQREGFYAHLLSEMCTYCDDTRVLVRHYLTNNNIDIEAIKCAQ